MSYKFIVINCANFVLLKFTGQDECKTNVYLQVNLVRVRDLFKVL